MILLDCLEGAFTLQNLLHNLFKQENIKNRLFCCDSVSNNKLSYYDIESEEKCICMYSEG